MRLMQLQGAHQFMPTPSTLSAGDMEQYCATETADGPRTALTPRCWLRPWQRSWAAALFSQITYDPKNERPRDACHSQFAGSVVQEPHMHDQGLASNCAAAPWAISWAIEDM